MREAIETIRALLREDELPDSPMLHAALFRMCAEWIGELRNALLKPLWWQQAAEIAANLSQAESVSRKKWLDATRELLSRQRSTQRDKLLVACSAVLQALDAHHREHSIDIERRSFDISRYLGRDGAKTAFLPPPKRPIQDLIAEPLVRDLGDLKNDLRTLLGLWWHLIALDEHQINPRYEELDPTVSEILEARVKAAPKDLAIGLASPFAKLEFQVESDMDRCHPNDGTPYRFAGIDAAHRRQAETAVEKIVAACAAQRIDILCFPELTLDHDLLGHLGSILQDSNHEAFPALVVAGSFHLQGDKCWRNRATVLDAWGNTLFEQTKCVAFKLPPTRAKEMGPEGMRLLGIDERGGYEDIDVGSDLRIVETPLGRLNTPICLDYCGDQVRDLLIESGVNFLLVPAMTPRMETFHQQAKDLGTRSRAMSFVINSAWLLRQLGHSRKKTRRRLLMAYLPRRGGLQIKAKKAKGSNDLRVFTIRVLLE